MNILIATPLWPPELGGPANYAKNLTREFRVAGHKVEVVSFTKEVSRVAAEDLKVISFVSLKFPTGLRHFLFFGKLLPKLYRADILLALDSFSVGLPAAIACLILRKPFVLRLEGDFLWESYVERTRKDVTLRQFYENPPPLIFQECFIRKITGWVMGRTNGLVFSSLWRRSMVLKSFNIALGKTVIIQNVWPGLPLPILDQPAFDRSKIDKIGNKKIIIWAGRMLYLKNIGRLLRAFARVNDGSYELQLVGEGPDRESLKLQVKSLKLTNKVKFIDTLPREELFKLLYSETAFFVLPSLSEVGPNVITEAAAAKTPFIMTKESGYTEYVSGFGLLVDPLDEDDLAAKIKILMDESMYREYKNRLKSLVFRHDWRETAGEWITLFREVSRS